MRLNWKSTERFAGRHIGPDRAEVEQMLRALSLRSVETLIDETVPGSIRMKEPLRLAPEVSETSALEELRKLARHNQVYKSYQGMGYSLCLIPGVIQRNILENPSWYTQYTPYQAEIAQGRLEALLNFQTMVIDLTGLPVANASLLDEATAAAEAMTLLRAARGKDTEPLFLVSPDVHPQTLAVLRTRAEPLGIELLVQDPRRFDWKRRPFALLLQYPASDGAVRDYTPLVQEAQQRECFTVVAADLLSLTLLKPPGEWGADVVVGNSQRFGVPMGFGGPHAAFMAVREKYTRLLPGRIIGVSTDAQGHRALRMALQTREQHIRREKATSNICTAQVLLAVMASMYAVYHGPGGLRAIAERVHGLTTLLAQGLEQLGLKVRHAAFFDTVCVALTAAKADEVMEAAEMSRMNFRRLDAEQITVSLDETTHPEDVDHILAAFAPGKADPMRVRDLPQDVHSPVPVSLQRTSAYLTHPVFHAHRSETEMLRYMKQLESKDLSLVHSMIPLGSCTMKLNATAEMIPVTWPEFSQLHPFAPAKQTQGYLELFRQLEGMLAEITGFAAVSLQPNAGSQGEYAGLLAIRRYHRSRNEGHRNICLIPSSAHGTNPASAVMVGYQVIVVKCDESGNIDLTDLKARAHEHREKLAALMVTYPSTHGVFEEDIKEICAAVHAHGGQVYMDGANMNAQVGLCRPGDMGADVCHLNLHKTFCIPHGGGGPGMGPIGVAAHLRAFLPGDPLEAASGAVSAAGWGSASILVISWVYIRMMGAQGLREATETAILNANYMAHRLSSHYPVLYRGRKGRVAHECILDLRGLKRSAGIEVEDVAKRLMDYGYHAPTVSFPVAGTLMVEPTESESLAELDRFCDALIQIRQEIAAVESGALPREDNMLRNAPHTARVVTQAEWTHPYSREQAAFPAAWVRASKFWPSVGRLNSVQGDRKLICSCPPVESYVEENAPATSPSLAQVG